jgi:hypothetical protein
MRGKAYGWGTFPKCGAKLGYRLILGHLFWECSHPRALPYTLGDLVPAAQFVWITKGISCWAKSLVKTELWFKREQNNQQSMTKRHVNCLYLTNLHSRSTSCKLQIAVQGLTQECAEYIRISQHKIQPKEDPELTSCLQSFDLNQEICRNECLLQGTLQRVSAE